ncbi:MAG TPA: 50S ribosomal protein L29 [Bacteroidia bacterium]|jgi:large subunit ribosomal protein L29|nr:50S ribosomal protein L29 [Bacteroidia bacterium]
MEKKEIAALSDQELIDKIKEGKENYGKLKLNHNVSPIENPIKIRDTRKTIARLQTEATKRKKAVK